MIGENYFNHETLGRLTIRKTGEVLANWKTEAGALDPWMTDEAEDGNFIYETRPLAGAEYTITAAEDIYTQDRQTDNYGQRTLWYAKGRCDRGSYYRRRQRRYFRFCPCPHQGNLRFSVRYP